MGSAAVCARTHTVGCHVLRLLLRGQCMYMQLSKLHAEAAAESAILPASPHAFLSCLVVVPVLATVSNWPLLLWHGLIQRMFQMYYYFPSPKVM